VSTPSSSQTNLAFTSTPPTARVSLVSADFQSVGGSC